MSESDELNFLVQVLNAILREIEIRKSRIPRSPCGYLLPVGSVMQYNDGVFARIGDRMILVPFLENWKLPPGLTKTEKIELPSDLELLLNHGLILQINQWSEHVELL